MSDVRVSGVRLYYEEHGEGAPILCIHGAGSTALMWDGAIGKLTRLGRVIAYDRRGCTRSERPDPYERTSVAEHADDALALLNALADEPAVVIGRSYGGAVAVDLALRHPERVKALALLEADAFGLAPSALEWTRAFERRLREVAGRDGVDAVYEVLVEELMGEGTWAEFPAEAREILSANGPALLAELRYVDDDWPSAEDYGGIEVPVLLVAATDSPPEQSEMSERMAEVIPAAQLARVSGGHMIDPAAPEVLAFVEEVLGSR